ncbi:MAG: hypothetical protein PHP44_05325, partial [Kiritimatiellae bacterium]|nr:hypothetical protein [Kiritimatiellia bacterium]
ATARHARMDTDFLWFFVFFVAVGWRKMAEIRRFLVKMAARERTEHKKNTNFNENMGFAGF